MAKYKVKNTNLLHNGNFVSIGSVIELTDEEAKILEDVVTLVKEPKTTDSKTSTNNKTNKTATKTDGETQQDKTTPADNTQTDGGNK